jgi:hypothetical protein
MTYYLVTPDGRSLTLTDSTLVAYCKRMSSNDMSSNGMSLDVESMYELVTEVIDTYKGYTLDNYIQDYTREPVDNGDSWTPEPLLDDLANGTLSRAKKLILVAKGFYVAGISKLDARPHF